MNPEDAVLDAIAELVDESIAHGPTDDYHRSFDARCEFCGSEWHGLSSEFGCPGAFATEEQRAAAAPLPPEEPLPVIEPFAMLRDLLVSSQRIIASVIGVELPEDPFDPAEWLGAIDGAPWVRATTWLPGDPEAEL